LINNAALVILIFLINYKQPTYISIWESILCDVSITILQDMQPHKHKMEWAGLLIAWTGTLVVCMDYLAKKCHLLYVITFPLFEILFLPHCDHMHHTRQFPIPYQLVNPFIFTPQTFAKPAVGAVFCICVPRWRNIPEHSFYLS